MALSIKDIIDLDYLATRQLNKNELVSYYNKMVSQANSRIKRLEKYYNKLGDGSKSPIPMLEQRLFKQADNIKYIPFVKKQQVTMQEFDKLKKFLNMKTSTVAGIKEVRDERDKRILAWYNKATNSRAKGLTREQYDEIGDLLQRMDELRDKAGSEKYPEEFKKAFTQTNNDKYKVIKVDRGDKVYKTYMHKSGKNKGKLYRHAVYEKTKFEAFRDTLRDVLNDYEDSIAEETKITTTLRRESESGFEESEY